MISDWGVPFTLLTPDGTLLFNDETEPLGLYLLIAGGCSIGPENVRLTKTNVPQADGSILHRRFLPGFQMQLAIQCWESREKPACDEQLVDMVDALAGCQRSLLNAGDNQGRVSWVPDGKNRRMLDDIRLLAYLAQSTDDKGLATYTFQVDTQYPYEQDEQETSTPVTDGVPVVLNNTGTAEFFPVFRVAGTTDSFTITNATLGIQFVYSGTEITSPDYAEIDTFRNTIYLNGDEDNLKASVDQLNSEYPILATGSNTITITGANMTVLWQPAWA